MRPLPRAALQETSIAFADALLVTLLLVDVDVVVVLELRIIVGGSGSRDASGCGVRVWAVCERRDVKRIMGAMVEDRAWVMVCC